MIKSPEINIGALGLSGLYRKIKKEELGKIFDVLKGTKKNINLHSSSAYEVSEVENINKYIASKLESSNISIHLRLFSNPKEFKNKKIVKSQIKKYKNLFGQNLKCIYIHKPLIKIEFLNLIVNEILEENITPGACIEKDNYLILNERYIENIEIPLNLIDLNKSSKLINKCKAKNKIIFGRSLLASGLLSLNNLNKRVYFDKFRSRFMNDKETLEKRITTANNIYRFYKKLPNEKSKSFEWFCYDLVKMYCNPDKIILGGSSLAQLQNNLNYAPKENMNIKDLNKLILDWSTDYYK